MRVAYKIGKTGGNLLCGFGLANAVVRTFDGLEALVIFMGKALKICLALESPQDFCLGFITSISISVMTLLVPSASTHSERLYYCFWLSLVEQRLFLGCGTWF
jgi:hypothetical protein